MFEWTIRNRESFYETMSHWWELHNFPQLMKESLPDSIFTVTHKESDTILYAIPVYTSDSNFCWIGFPTSNKEALKEHKEGALQYLLDQVHIWLKKDNKILITTSDTPVLMKLFKNNGYIESDQGTNYYTKKL